MRKCWYPAFFPFFHNVFYPFERPVPSLDPHIICVMQKVQTDEFKILLFGNTYISHKTLEIGCAWSKGSGERLQGHHGPLVYTELA